MINSRRFIVLHYRTILAVCLLCLLGACTILPPAQSLSQYRLPVHDAASGTGGSLPASLLVRVPYAGTPINSARILVVPPDSGEISAYAGARWQDDAHILWRNRLVRAFRSDARLAAVTVDASLIDVNYELAGELHAFQVEHPDGLPVVHLRFDALLIEAVTNESLASRVFELVLPASGKEVPQIVAAFGQANDQLATQVVQWATDWIDRLPANYHP